ncbi:sulfotransferase family protein [Rhabdothermincola salaria]|uniref:sulfotransferase family protein n=1 Tax=Rhabdothermincola salaria TaxID=2903142 RepID=UPI001E4F6DA1|nr:sulfotransferase [Rhabdothermincola salaria]MCD9624198.1 sulfotransferase [Rhabdothermincola salaria]
MADTQELERDWILEEAGRRTGGLTDLGPNGDIYLEGLDRTLDSLRTEADLNELGHMIARERMLLHTANRLGYVDDRKTDPAIATQQIVKPVFIIGMPRTGTTILHDILASDPANRAPLTWETMFPSPPPRAETFTTDPRIAACAATFPAQDEQIPEFKAIHPMGAELSQECVTMMGEAMITPLFHNQFRVPSYEDWVDTDAPWSSVYEFHLTQLQHLQAHNAGDRWVLKTGAHLWGLDHLLETYPDARIVFTHRDPVKSMTSYASLTTLVRGVGSDSVDPAEVAADWTPRLRNVLMNGIHVRQAKEYPDAVFYDVLFTDFVKDQFAVVESIYDAFDLPMSDEGARAMKAFIDDNPPGKHGVHSYRPEDYGIVPDQIRADFAEYVHHFGLPPEEKPGVDTMPG